jgi:ankyrin repeat protein
LENGADLEAKDRREDTPLIVAVRANHVETCRVLLDAGANANITDEKGKTVLEIAERLSPRRKGDPDNTELLKLLRTKSKTK